jgi:hypothetical protein
LPPRWQIPPRALLYGFYTEQHEDIPFDLPKSTVVSVDEYGNAYNDAPDEVGGTWYDALAGPDLWATLGLWLFGVRVERRTGLCLLR